MYRPFYDWTRMQELLTAEYGKGWDSGKHDIPGFITTHHSELCAKSVEFDEASHGPYVPSNIDCTYLRVSREWISQHAPNIIELIVGELQMPPTGRQAPARWLRATVRLSGYSPGAHSECTFDVDYGARPCLIREKTGQNGPRVLASAHREAEKAAILSLNAAESSQHRTTIMHESSSTARFGMYVCQVMAHEEAKARGESTNTRITYEEDELSIYGPRSPLWYERLRS